MWLSQETRPDLSYSVLMLAKKNDITTISDLRNVNIIYIYICSSHIVLLYMVLRVNTTHSLLVEIILQMFPSYGSRGSVSLFKLEFISLTSR